MEDELHEHLEAVAKIFQIQDQKYKQELSEKQDLLTIKSKQNSDLQDENSRLLSIVQDLERKLLLSQSETKSLQSSFDSLSLRYQNVKKAASQLEAFRKNSPITLPLEQDQEPMSLKSDHSLLTLVDSNGKKSDEFKDVWKQSRSGSAFVERDSIDESLLVNEQFPGDQSLFLESMLHTDPPKDSMESLTTPYTEHLLHQLNKSSDSIQNVLKSNSAVDAAMLYRTIKQKVSKPVFDEFASVISMFNAGTKSPLQTIEQVSELLRDDELTLQMSRLICNAIQ